MKLETFLDVLLIEEIPVEDAQSTGIVNASGKQIIRSERASKKPQTGKVISADTKFPWYGQMVDMPYKIGDVVRTNEFGRDYILLDPEDEFKPNAVKYYLIHYADVQGRVAKETREHHRTMFGTVKDCDKATMLVTRSVPDAS